MNRISTTEYSPRTKQINRTNHSALYLKEELILHDDSGRAGPTVGEPNSCSYLSQLWPEFESKLKSLATDRQKHHGKAKKRALLFVSYREYSWETEIFWQVFTFRTARSGMAETMTYKGKNEKSTIGAVKCNKVVTIQELGRIITPECGS